MHFSEIAGDGFGTLHDGEVVVYQIDGITTNQPQARNVHALGVQSRHTACRTRLSRARHRPSRTCVAAETMTGDVAAGRIMRKTHACTRTSPDRGHRGPTTHRARRRAVVRRPGRTPALPATHRPHRSGRRPQVGGHHSPPGCRGTVCERDRSRRRRDRGRAPPVPRSRRQRCADRGSQQ
ncbi:hypothetical protein [Rhodococcus sp. WB9]|uniref:hypothetical protein n=1 Tax=Rhodococcus sp. WB9 TaxID=2594007 RepID=UPI0037C89CA4